MGSDSLAAINYRQFYVTTSRGSKDVRLFVDDKAKVRRAIARSGEQMSATELVKQAKQPPVPAPAVPAPTVTPERQNQRHRAVSWLRDRAMQWWRQRQESRQQQPADQPKRQNEPSLTQRTMQYFVPPQPPERRI